MVRLEDPLEIGGLTVPNRLYRAPLLECAGNGEGAVDALVSHLEPAAAAGAGLICQGATIVRGPGGCAAPNMTYVDDPSFVSRLSRLTETIHEHGSTIAIQLEHGGLRSMETWHAGYREAHPSYQQLAVSPVPPLLDWADRLGFLSYDPQVMSTDEVYELAADFGQAAEAAVDAGYDAVHIAGANMGIVQQFLSPFYNRRNDEFADGVRFLEVVHDEIRARAGDVPLLTKVPAETEAPPGVPHITDREAVHVCRRLSDYGYDALVPVSGSVFWDASIVRGAFPDAAWRDERFHDGYVEAFGSRVRAGLVALGNWFESLVYDFEPAWNAGLTRAVRRVVDVPVLAEGGIRTRGEIDRLLGTACDMVGIGRPFYAEPRLPARLLDAGPEAAVVCESCNNCTVPQVTGAGGVCRTPEILRRVGQLKRSGAYERSGTASNTGDDEEKDDT